MLALSINRPQHERNLHFFRHSNLSNWYNHKLPKNVPYPTLPSFKGRDLSSRAGPQSQKWSDQQITVNPTGSIHKKARGKKFDPKKVDFDEGVFVWKPENPHYGVKNQSCRKLHIWVSKPIRRKIQNQWKKLELNRAYQLREKSKKPPENTVFERSDILGGFLNFSLNW